MSPTLGRVLRSVVAVAAAGALLAGCTTAVSGQAAKIGTATVPSQPVDVGPSGPKNDVAPATVAVTADGHTKWDTQAKNTIADLYVFYGEVFPESFKERFTPAKELKSYDSNDPKATVCGRSLYHSVNASYNPGCDTIVWDRGVLLPRMGKDVGDLGAPTILAHEMGHLVQARLDEDMSDSDDVIMLEQQADCYAGAYWRWVADGHSTYYDLNRTSGVKEVLAAMMSTGDPVGLSPKAAQAHGSGFDRSFAFSLGFTNGAVRCSKIDQAEVDARIKETGFTVKPQNYGNVKITDGFLQQIVAVTNSYFAGKVPGYKAPTLAPYTGGAPPACASNAMSTPVGFCAATNTVAYNLAELQRIGTPTAGWNSRNGDMSAVILLVSRYALAAAAATGAPTTGDQAGLRALCYAGSWANWMRTPQGTGDRKLTLSPNDLDKAVYEVMASSLPAADASGGTSTGAIDQVQALYVGVVLGLQRCTDFYAG
ncbi:hypothetical protein [Nakamurella endophytica]|uniref:Aminopeptidase n=1 Tax=Nakamurella endophytica TaxID=1748367 RepID=A0A917SZ16_9ACTN|nr:hypothetical protein [Nakamurella endophytica]GGM04428.1 aminopeptidase [Nakamurella endophytica]